MNIYSRIRSIENAQEFKHLVDSLMGAEYGKNYQSIKEWKDYGFDGYQKKEKVVFALNCPRYPERHQLQQYKDKIRSDLEKLYKAISEGRVKLTVKEWIFVTPDDLALEVIDFAHRECEKYGWQSGTLTAQVLAPLFMKHRNLLVNFPNLALGLESDKVPSVSVHFARNRGYNMLEVFNDGTEDIKDMHVSIQGEAIGSRDLVNNFMYEFDNPVMGSIHSLFNLKRGERQYGRDVPTNGNFHYKVSGVGVESSRTFVVEGFIHPTAGVNF